MAQQATEVESEEETTQAYSKGTTRAYCRGCGKDMWEYSEEAKEDGWCISCAPECYVGATHVAALED